MAQKPEELTIEYVSVDKLKPYPGNPRKIDEKEMAKLRRSLRDFGFVDPLICQKNGTVIGGHQRLEAAKAENIKAVPVVYIDVPYDKAKLLNIALNKISGEWDWSKLGDMFQDLDTGEIDLEMSGFDMSEIEGLMNGLDSASVDRNAEWVGMPEFESQNLQGVRQLIVHFKTDEDVEAFSTLVGQTITAKTKYIWYPQAEIEKYSDKRYVSES